VNIAFDLIN